MTETLPKLEELLGAEEMERVTSEVKELACKSYQPFVDNIVKRVGIGNTTVTVTSDVKLALVVQDGQPVITNEVALGLEFHPTVTYDVFEQAQRVIITNLFAGAMKK